MRRESLKSLAQMNWQIKIECKSCVASGFAERSRVMNTTADADMKPFIDVRAPAMIKINFHNICVPLHLHVLRHSSPQRNRRCRRIPWPARKQNKLNQWTKWSDAKWFMCCWSFCLCFAAMQSRFDCTMNWIRWWTMWLRMENRDSPICCSAFTYAEVSRTRFPPSGF